MAHVVALPEDTVRFRCAIGHVPDPKRRGAHVLAPLAWAAMGLKGAGAGLGMSIGDLMKFVDMHVRGNRSGGDKVLRRASARAMQRRQVRLPRHSEQGIDGWGIGWGLFSWSGKRIVGHDGGSLIGQYAYLRVLPEKQLAVALFTNGGDSASLYETLFKSTFEPLGGVTMATLPEPADGIEFEPERYVGEYENLTGRFVIDSNRQGLEIAFRAEPVLLVPGPNIAPTPIRFIDRNTARFASGNHKLDRLPIIFHGNGPDSPHYLNFALRVYPRL
jgi:CubicO group peptidase (beta-lactamase class C family)